MLWDNSKNNINKNNNNYIYNYKAYKNYIHKKCNKLYLILIYKNKH